MESLSNEFLHFLTEENGYTYIKVIEDRGVCAIQRFTFTTAIVYGIDDSGYVGRFCFHTKKEALDSFNLWDGKEDPYGDWIKHKGYTEYRNPNIKNTNHGIN